jgi:RNA polymerase sigma-70 factor (ECF subfamily)
MTAGSARVGWTAPPTASPADQDQSDDALIHRIADGDKVAMRILFGRHQVRLYRFVLRIVGDHGQAEDLVNEVFLEVWRHADRFEGRSAVSTWLLAIARRSAISALRKRKEVELDDTTALEVVDPADDPETTLHRVEETNAVRSCLGLLSRNHTEIIDLVYYHERSVNDVARILGIPQATVKTRMFYARKKLAELLKCMSGRLKPHG